MVTKKVFILEGRLLTPIITSTPLLKKGRVWIQIVSDLQSNKKSMKSYIGKLVKGEQKVPVQLLAYRGFVRVTCLDENSSRAQAIISKYLTMNCLGNKISDGFGKIEWLNYREELYQRLQPEPKRKKFKIRKGLGPNYPIELQRLLIALMLHDFVHTERHQSKIYQEVPIEDEEIRNACLYHHNGEESNNKLLPIVKYYDHLASYISRKRPLKTKSRYDFKNGRIDFKQLVKEIELRQQSAFKLYNYIYQSKELTQVVEAMTYGKNNLRNHLLVMVNLAINDYLKKKLTIKKGKITIERKKL